MESSKKWKKLTPADVAEICARARAGACKCALAREYGIAHQTVDYHLAHRKESENLYAEALAAACQLRRERKIALAAETLRLAATILEAQHSTKKMAA